MCSFFNSFIFLGYVKTTNFSSPDFIFPWFIIFNDSCSPSVSNMAYGLSLIDSGVQTLRCRCSHLDFKCAFLLGRDGMVFSFLRFCVFFLFFSLLELDLYKQLQQRRIHERSLALVEKSSVQRAHSVFVESFFIE